MKTSVRELLVVHHTHTDWGYTTHPSRIAETHYRFIDQAVELCSRNADRPDSMRYRWTCECAWVVDGYLRDRTPGQRAAFLEGVACGHIEVAALPLHPSPLADLDTIRAALAILGRLRAEGIPISVALGCDINGLSWPWAEALLEAEVPHLAMAMNFVAGGGLPRWTAFHWESPRGRHLLCWQGTHYNQGAYWGLNHDAYPSSEVAPERVREIEGVPYEKLLLQVTNIPPDNMGPHPGYLDGLETYNVLAREHDWPIMRTSSLAEWFAYLAGCSSEAPVYSGDWTDWWASSEGSTPRETAAVMEAQRRMRLAEQRGLSSEVSGEVRRKIFLAAEHTWGASSSVEAPYGLAAQAGVAAKANLAYETLYAATEALRSSLTAGAALHDPEMESFDPGWRAIGTSSQDSSPFHSSPSETAPPDWSCFLPGDAPQVLHEQPADGSRRTWYEFGNFSRPEAHGCWPENPQWKISPLEQVEINRAEDSSCLRFELKLQLPPTEHPRSVYIIFPFCLPGAEVLADVGGAWANPAAGNIPGSCKNWWTVHRGILLSSPGGSLLWTSWDAPLTMFDAPCPNPPKLRNELIGPTLVSWVLNTYWTTNAAAISGGDYRFRYRVKWWPQAITPQEAEQFCDQDPLPSYPGVLTRTQHPEVKE